MDSNQEKSIKLMQELMYLDITLKDEGLFWRSKSKEQGFNVATIKDPLSESEGESFIQALGEITSELDRLNCTTLQKNNINVPAIRLNRLDIGVDKSGGVFLIEQNPGWVDLLGFSGLLSVDPRVLFYLTKMLKEEMGVKSLEFLYSDYTKFAKYEMEATADIVARKTSLSTTVKAIGEVQDASMNIDTAYYLNSPYEWLSVEEREIIDRLTKSGLVFPGKEMSFLDDKSLLLELDKYRPETVRFPDSFDEFIKVVRSGLNMVKPTRSFSTQGVVARVDDLYEGGFLQVYEAVKSSGREYLIEKEIDLITANGVGYDYVGNEKARPRQYKNFKGKNVLAPISVKIDDWPVKYCVWTLNDMVGPVVGVASRGSDQIVINDAGFFFRIGR